MTDTTADFLGRLTAALPPGTVIPGPEAQDRYCHDWSGLAPVRPLAVVLPRSTEDVATCLRLCHASEMGVVPQGGLTGIAGGAQPVAGCIVLNLERMSAVEEVDTVMATMTVQAGTPLATVQAAAEEAGFAFMVDLGARGSCAIGGNISTNAGGNRVIRYGMAREHVLGLEFVLADGTVVRSLNKMLKNNAGYDLKQMLIGSEGTLGIITRAVLRLQAKPTSVSTALCRCADFEAVLSVLKGARKRLGPSLTAFEVMWPSFYDTMYGGLPQLRRPFGNGGGIHIIVEASGFDPGRDAERFEECLGALVEEGVVDDVIVAASERETRDIWAVRESVSEYGRVLGRIVAFDIGLPTTMIGDFVDAATRELAARWPDVRPLAYGHIGDSNLHLVVNVPSAGDHQPEHEIDDLVYGMAGGAGGTISAEHGIGLVKKPYLGRSRSEAELATMRRLKQALDPRGILNPGKVV
jgi:FAD/FMN-containing dehydrogenase